MNHRSLAHTCTVLLLSAVLSCPGIALPGYAQPLINVTGPDGEAPEEKFTDLTMAPGDTNTETILISQDTDESMKAGIRFESLSEPTPLHDALQLTIEGLGSSVEMPLHEALDTELPFWLGELPPDENALLTITAHLPSSAGNETQQTQAHFTVIISARATLPLDPDGSSPANPPEPEQGSEPGQGGNPDQSEPGHGGGVDPGTGPERTEPGHDSEPDRGAGLEPGNDPEADGQLPRTGANILLACAIGAALLGLGTLVVRATRRRR